MIDDNEQAARWFAASRRGVMLHDERAAYEDWRRVPANAARLAELHSVWQALDPAGAVADHGLDLPAQHSRTAHRRQVAAMVAFVSVTATLMTRIDGGWWSALDWWSR
jgi:transmembrane sensor